MSADRATVERMAYGYELMHTAICHMAGTSGADGRWYMLKAQEVQARVSPVWNIGPDSNPHKPGDCLSAYRRSVPNNPNADIAAEVLATLYQYVDDLRYPPVGDSIERRIKAAEAVIAKVSA